MVFQAHLLQYLIHNGLIAGIKLEDFLAREIIMKLTGLINYSLNIFLSLITIS